MNAILFFSILNDQGVVIMIYFFVYFTSQMGTFHMWKFYLLMCFLLFVETGSDSVHKTGLKLMAILLPQSPQIWTKGMHYHTPLRNAFEVMGCTQPCPTWHLYDTIPEPKD